MGEQGRPETLVIALGGNAIKAAGEQGTSTEQFRNVQRAADTVAELVVRGYRVVVTHGNGPQVGNLLIQQAAGAAQVPAMPMDVAGAMTQGWIGYMIQQCLRNALVRRGHPAARAVTTIITQTIVDRGDPAFENPTKPVGPFYGADDAQRMRYAGMRLVEDSGRGWRRIVASPQPRAIAEIDAIGAMLRDGMLVIAGGGGGIPVIQEADGTLTGVEAVIDKDLGAAMLAQQVGATRLLILTDVEKVAIHYKKPDQRDLDHLTPGEARAYLGEGYFAKGSMGPKVQAAVNFVEAGGEQAIITQLFAALDALAGKTGTVVSATAPLPRIGQEGASG
ncbi:MAG TPA: carbamate kinase [Chloroflexia bacterium]|nr:carbamate kinase [Chloroflexia bacterium]